MNMILRALCLAATLAAGQMAHGATTCQFTPNGNLCTTQVDFNRFAQSAFQTQSLTQWCWAASISMVFSFHGYKVAQSRIVSEAYGSVVNLPAVAGVVMAQALNRTWVDDSQRTFVSHLNGAYDPAAGFVNLDNNRLIQELDAGRPFIVGTNGHAVVATAIQYFPTSAGPIVAGIGVFDPWPGRGARSLTQAEMVPVTAGGQLTFVATADVSAPSSGAVQNPFSAGGGATDHVLIGGLFALLIGVLLRRRRRA